MSRVSRSDVIELIFWLAFAGLAYAFSFRFSQEIEIYKFGASAWPRAIILLIAIAAILQFIQAKQNTDPATTTKNEAFEARSRAELVRITLLLATPIIYAALLDISGFYFTTPIFIFIYLLLNGERRIGWLIGVTVFIYAFILIVFTKLLYVGLPIGYVSPFYDFSNWLLVLIR